MWVKKKDLRLSSLYSLAAWLDASLVAPIQKVWAGPTPFVDYGAARLAGVARYAEQKALVPPPHLPTLRFLRGETSKVPSLWRRIA